jgi:hypothetical protein
MSRFTEKEDYIKRSLEGAWKYMDKPDFVERTERLQDFGIRAEVSDVLYSLDTYVPVGVSDGDYLRSLGDDDERSIAVIALEPGETIEARISRHRLQGDATDFVKAKFTQESDMGAQTFAPTHIERYSDNDEMTVRAMRPTVALTYEDGKEKVSPMIIHHELFHAAMRLNTPDVRYKDNPTDQLIHYTNEEFDAYDFQATLFESRIYDYICPTNGLAKVVKEFKYSQLKSPDFRVDRQTMLDIAAHDVLQYLLPETALVPIKS